LPRSEFLGLWELLMESSPTPDGVREATTETGLRRRRRQQPRRHPRRQRRRPQSPEAAAVAAAVRTPPPLLHPATCPLVGAAADRRPGEARPGTLVKRSSPLTTRTRTRTTPTKSIGTPPTTTRRGPPSLTATTPPPVAPGSRGGTHPPTVLAPGSGGSCTGASIFGAFPSLLPPRRVQRPLPAVVPRPQRL